MSIGCIYIYFPKKNSDSSILAGTELSSKKKLCHYGSAVLTMFTAFTDPTKTSLLETSLLCSTHPRHRLTLTIITAQSVRNRSIVIDGIFFPNWILGACKWYTCRWLVVPRATEIWLDDLSDHTGFFCSFSKTLIGHYYIESYIGDANLRLSFTIKIKKFIYTK